MGMKHKGDGMKEKVMARAALGLGFLLAGAFAQAQPYTFTYLGQTITPNGATLSAPTTASTTVGTGTIGGVSGLEWLGQGNSYVAVIDGRNPTSAGAARFYNVELDISKFVRSNTPGSAGVVYTGAQTLRNGGSLTDPGYTQSQRDPESIRYLSASNTFLMSTEGFRQTGNISNPTIEEVRADGTRVRFLNVPSLYNPTGSTGGNTTGDAGVRDNGGFEPMALSPDGKTAFAANELTLAQDGTSSSGRHRLTRYAVELWLTEILPGTTNVSGVASLVPGGYTAMTKTQLLSLGTLTNTDGSIMRRGNVESLTWGPVYNGQQTLILASDNNFRTTNDATNGGTAGDFTQYIALATNLAPIPEPAAFLLMPLGLGIVLARKSRAKAA
jgi:hypothetical protein